MESVVATSSTSDRRRRASSSESPFTQPQLTHRGLVGVSSAYVQHNPQLRMDLWCYRALVARAHRKSNVASRWR
jgi:hypothetical protein